MIFDTTLLFSDAQAITGDAASTNVIDFGAPGTVYGAAAALTRDLGKGKKVPLSIQVVEAFNTLTSLDITVQVDNDVAFGSPKSVATVNVLLAALTAGKVINIDDIPLGSDERYMRLLYNVNGTDPTLGKVTAGVVAGLQTSGVNF